MKKNKILFFLAFAPFICGVLPVSAAVIDHGDGTQSVDNSGASGNFTTDAQVTVTGTLVGSGETPPPVDPTDPVDPVDPVDPTEPTSPTDPSKPTPSQEPKGEQDKGMIKSSPPQTKTLNRLPSTGEVLGQSLSFVGLLLVIGVAWFILGMKRYREEEEEEKS